MDGTFYAQLELRSLVDGARIAAGLIAGLNAYQAARGIANRRYARALLWTANAVVVTGLAHLATLLLGLFDGTPAATRDSLVLFGLASAGGYVVSALGFRLPRFRVPALARTTSERPRR